MNSSKLTVRIGFAALGLAAALTTAASPATAAPGTGSPIPLTTAIAADSPDTTAIGTGDSGLTLPSDGGRQLLPISSGSSAPCLFSGCRIGGPDEYS
ncbi:hypothetical protein ACFXHA_14390 [Nocardia sp. NPDC059240]|uniref:hypothetical protein n=1 Tax=Nocardia sp. NPDC059240 TaxID=3346786 RepID=UPI003696B28B